MTGSAETETGRPHENRPDITNGPSDAMHGFYARSALAARRASR